MWYDLYYGSGAREVEGGELSRHFLRFYLYAIVWVLQETTIIYTHSEILLFSYERIIFARTLSDFLNFFFSSSAEMCTLS